MSKVLSFRVSDEEAAWADEYAKGRGVSRGDFLAEGFRSWRRDCESGVPDIPKPPKPPSKAELTAAQQERARHQAEWAQAMGERQRKLNEAKDRATAARR